MHKPDDQPSYAAAGVDVARARSGLTGLLGWVQRTLPLRPGVGRSVLPIGYFGASTGAAAALVAAAQLKDAVHAIVSRGGRPDLAGHALDEVRAPTLLIVGGYDEPVFDFNRDALGRLRGVKALRIVPRAGHLFEEPGAMAHVIALARAWFDEHLTGHAAASGILGDRS